MTKKIITRPPLPKEHIGTIKKKRFSHAEILQAIEQYAAKLNQIYANQELLIISVLTGAIYFTVHLTYFLNFNFQLDFLAASSYEGDKQARKVKFHKQTVPLAGKNVLVLEDIVDGGLTMQTIMKYVIAQKPKSVRFCSLITFFTPKKTNDYVFESLFASYDRPWLVGFGLDYSGHYRSLPDVYEFVSKISKTET